MNAGILTKGYGINQRIILNGFVASLPMFSGNSTISVPNSTVVGASSFSKPHYVSSSELSSRSTFGSSGGPEVPTYVGLSSVFTQFAFDSSSDVSTPLYSGDAHNFSPAPSFAVSGERDSPVYSASLAIPISPVVHGTGENVAPYFVGESSLDCKGVLSADSHYAGIFSGSSALSAVVGFHSIGIEPPNYFGNMDAVVNSTISSISSINVSFIGETVATTPMITVDSKSFSGLFAWWDFEGDILDKTGNDNPLTLYGNAHVTNGVLVTDGGIDRAESTDNEFDMATGSFSIVMRVRPSVVDGEYRTIVSKRNPNFTGFTLYQDAFSHKIAFVASANGLAPFPTTRSNISVVPNQTYHIAAIINRTLGRMQLYVDGVLHDESDISTMGALQNSTRLTIGRESGQSSWKGTFIDSRIYKRSLTHHEVATLHSGVNLHGDIPVNGSHLPPIYMGHVVELSSNSNFSAFSLFDIPIYSGYANQVTDHGFVSVGASDVPVFHGSHDGQVGSEFLGDASFSIPIYAGSSTFNVSIAVGSHGGGAPPVFYGSSDPFPLRLSATLGGLFSIPTYSASATMLVGTPVYGSDGTMPRFYGDAFVDIGVMFASSGEFSVPIYTGLISTSIVSAFESETTLVIPYYFADADLNNSVSILSSGTYYIPDYSGEATMTISPAVNILGVNDYVGFFYETHSYIVNRVVVSSYVVNDYRIVSSMPRYNRSSGVI